MPIQPRIIEAWQECRSVSTDTRKIKSGQIFFALSGENFNGNKFAAQALEKGAAYAVIDDPEFQVEDDARYILVVDSLAALQELGRWERRQRPHPFIAITGSNGKTTTKELMHAVLSTEKKCYATEGNLNNHIGVPLTLLSLPKEIDLAIIEMGANKPKDIEELVLIAEPNYGLITNIGKAHLEQMGGLDGVERTKGEMFDFIREHEGCAWVNEADARIVRRAEGIDCTTGYGGPQSDYRIARIEELADGMTVHIIAPEWEGEKAFPTKLYGAHNAQNVLAAVCAGCQMGISPEGIERGIAEYLPRMNRTQFMDLAGIRILLDAYNANPSSMEATLRSVFRQKHGQVGVALGDMFELGEHEEEAHRELGRLVKELEPAKFFAFGPLMKFAVEEAEGVPTDWHADAPSAEPSFREAVKGLDFLLIKGSRGMALERLTEFLKD